MFAPSIETVTTSPHGSDASNAGAPEPDDAHERAGDTGFDRELRQVLDVMVESACDLVDATYGAILVAGTDWHLDEFVTCGLTREEKDRIGGLPRLRRLLGMVLEARQPVRLSHLHDHPTAQQVTPELKINTLLSAPIDLRDASYGHLYLANKQDDAEFTAKDEQVAVALAMAAANAIQNARLLRQQDRRQRWLRGTAELTRQLVGLGDLGDAMVRVTECVREISGADYAAIGLVDPSEPDSIVYEAVDGLGLDGREGTRTPRRGIAGCVIDSGQSTLVQDLLRDGRYVPPDGWEEPLAELGLTMFMPLSAPDEVSGTLVVGWRRDSPASRVAASEDALIQTFAGQAALALQRVRAQQERLRHERWLEATADMARLLLREVDRDEAMRLVVRRVREITRADFGGIMLADPQDPDSCYVIVFEGLGMADAPPDLRIPRAGLLARVLATGQRIVSDDYPQQEGHDPPEIWAEALSSVGLGTLIPLGADGQVLGALFAAWRRGSPHERTAAAQIEQVQTLADLTALALQRVRTQDDRAQLLVLEERHRIAREMHDVVIQRIFGAGMRLRSAEGMSTESRVQERVREALTDLDETSHHIRSSVLQLPDEDDDQLS